jgi:rfaE bifunctional protein nucleotidyltransferase chain/domain
MPSKLSSLEELVDIVRKHQSAGRIIVFSNGCFDLLHAGHIRYLEAAKEEGDILIVGINGDDSVKSLKGSGRPLMPESERAEIISALECVDYVLVFHDSTVDRLLLRLKPDVHAKGTDYSQESVPERKTVLGYGGRIAIVGDPKNHSTRDYLDKIRDGGH